MNKLRLFLIRLLGGEQVHIIHIDIKRRSVLHHWSCTVNSFITYRAVRLNHFDTVYLDTTNKKVEWEYGPRRRKGKVLFEL